MGTFQNNMDTQILLPPIIIANIIHFCGIFGNVSIIIATFTSKQLRNNCNLLIAIEALFNLFGEFGGLVEVFTVYVPTDLLIDSRLCFYLQVVPAIGIIMSTVIPLMIGIDRVIAIKYPTRYVKFNSIYYLIVLLAPGVALNLIFIPIAYINTKDQLKICGTNNIYSGTLIYIYLAIAIVIYILAIVVYIYMFYLTKTITFSNASIQTTKKIQKSLLIIVCVTLIGALIGVAYAFGSSVFGGISIGNTPLGKYASSRYFLDCTYVGMAASYYIYFYNSTEYRIAFVAILRKYLGLRFFSRFIPKQSVTPMIAFTGKSQSHHIPVNHQ